MTKNPRRRPDADKLLHHAFCSEGRKATRRALRGLLDRHDALKKDKYDRSDYVTGDTSTDEDDNNELANKQKEEQPPEKLSTVKKRIRSRKEPPKKKGAPPAPPTKPQRPTSDNFESGLDKPDCATIKPESYTIKPLPPPPPSAPLPEPPTIGTLTLAEPEEDQKPPPLPPRDTNTAKLSAPTTSTTLNHDVMTNPPPLPPRSPGGRRRAQNGRPLSQLFVQKPAKNCFTKIFNECPLTLNCAASWTHPESRESHLLFASKEGIYSLVLGDNGGNVEMIQIFSRSCKWLYVFKNILVSMCGKDSNVYMHNLLSLHEKKEDGGGGAQGNR